MRFNKNQIILMIPIMYVLQSFFLGEEAFTTLLLVILAWYLVERRGCIAVPRIPGIKLYIVLLAFISLVGFIKFTPYLVIRDIYYEFNNLVAIYIGYIICFKHEDDDAFFKTIFGSIGMVSIIAVVLGVVSLASGASFFVLRQSFSVGIKSIEVFLPIFCVYFFMFNKVCFSKRIDRLILICMIVQAFANLSRTTIAGVFIGLFVITMALQMKGIKNLKSIAVILGGILVIVVGSSVLIKVLPDTIASTYLTKVFNTLNEIDAKLTFNSLADANSNWRGYEIYCAQTQWINCSIIEKIIGSGNGRMIELFYVPDQWQAIMVTQYGKQGVPMLHNSYYTLLIKGGVLLVVVFIAMLYRNVKKGYRAIRKYNSSSINIMALTLMSLSCVMFFDAYIIRGLVESDVQLLWAVSFGWLNCRLTNSDMINIESSNKT